MRLVLKEKSTGIKIAWFFMFVTIGAFLSELQEAEGTFNNVYESGYKAGGKLGLILLLGIGMLLYNRTKKRKFGHPVKGSKIVDYILLLILSINFISLLLSGSWVNGTGDNVLAFSYVTVSLLAYVYALLAKPKTELAKQAES